TTINSGTLQNGNGGTTGTLGTGIVVNNASLTFGRSDSLTVANAISGTGSVSQSGGGTTTLGGANTYTGTTVAFAGTLLVTGSNPFTSTTATGLSTVLGGSGTLGDVGIDLDATLAPGLSPGILNTGNLTFFSPSNYRVEINSAVAGAGYDQINVAGTVTLGSNLVLTGARTDTTADVITIINNDGTDPVNGTFSGLPEGTITTLNGVQYVVSY